MKLRATLTIADHAYVMDRRAMVNEGNGQALLDDPNVSENNLGF